MSVFEIVCTSSKKILTIFLAVVFFKPLFSRVQHLCWQRVPNACCLTTILRQQVVLIPGNRGKNSSQNPEHITFLSSCVMLRQSDPDSCNTVIFNT